METRNELEGKLATLRKEYRSVYSMLSMMEKSTRVEDLMKMRREQLDPIKREMERVERALKEDP